MSCDPQTMMSDAKCIVSCIPQSSHDAIQTAVLAEINGGSTDAATLMQQAAAFQAIPPRQQIALQVYLLCQILGQGNCTPEQLAIAARCYQCIPRGWQKAMQTYQICRWSEGGQGVCDHPVVLDWLARLAADFQPRPSDDTIRAVCTFCEALDTYGIMDKMLVVNPIIPDSFLAMRYPLIWQPTNGFSPFINHNFVDGDLDGDGLMGADTKYMNTGFIPETHWGVQTTSGGISIYESDVSTLPLTNETECGVTTAAGENLQLGTWASGSGTTNATCWNAASGIVVAQADTPAFYSMNRVSNTDFRIYRGNGTIPFAQLGATNIANQAGTTLPDISCFFMAANTLGVPDSYAEKKVSFMAIHEGLLQGGGFTEVEDFFNAVQTLRVDLNGGFV